MGKGKTLDVQKYVQNAAYNMAPTKSIYKHTTSKEVFKQFKTLSL